MKNVFFNAISVLCALILLPLGVLSESENKIPVNSSAVSAQKNDIEYTDTPSSDVFRILIKETGKVENLDADTYITGVVAAEMPALYETEALKAQAVAAYTYACRKRSASADKKYDLTDDPNSDQCYISTEEMQKKWGEHTQEYTKKISEAVKAVSGKYLDYKGTPAMTVYHAVSSGRTESCKDVWGSALEYLVPVDSLGDRLEENYLYTAEFTKEQISEKLKALCDIKDDGSSWFTNPETTESGRVKNITVCGTELTGAQIADALSLPSANFTVSQKGENFTVESRGRGHGVGMSQHGADYMAKQGSDYKEILLHYYTGCTLEEKQ